MNILKIRETRIKNVMTLTLRSKSLGKQGWTVKELAQICSQSERAIRLFVNRLIILGYVQKVSNSTYIYIKAIPTNIYSMNRTVQAIAKNFNKNIYTNKASLLASIPAIDLQLELERRGYSVKRHDF